MLTDAERDKLEGLLRSLLPDRNPVAETMVWCIEHAEAGEEVVECISESLGILQTPLTKKIARLYLISDILHNCSVKGVPNVSYYRKGFQVKFQKFYLQFGNTILEVFSYVCEITIIGSVRLEKTNLIILLEL